MLKISGLEAGYGSSQVLFGVDLEIGGGEVVTLLGRNGMGKTTTVRVVMGLMGARAGGIRFDGREILRLPSYAIARLGLGLVPEGRQVFPNLTVRENLVVAAANRGGSETPWNLGRIYELFPRLAERADNRGDRLSGGEQQMLAIGRALMTNPKLLILDEATEGLAPLIRAEIWDVLETLKRVRESILVIDKNLDALLRIADRHYIMQKGQVVWSGGSVELARDADLQARYLGV